MNVVQNEALATYDIHDFLVDGEQATSWNVEKGSTVLHQLLREQANLSEQRTALRDLGDAHGIVGAVALGASKQVATLTKITSHMYRALSSVLAALGTLPAEVKGGSNNGFFSEPLHRGSIQPLHSSYLLSMYQGLVVIGTQGGACSPLSGCLHTH